MSYTNSKSIRFFSLRKMKGIKCPAVNPITWFIGWSDKTIHINIPILIGSLIIEIQKHEHEKITTTDYL